MAQLKVKAGGGSQSSGKRGQARGNSASSILQYVKDVRAADYYRQAGHDNGQAPQILAGSGWESLGLEPGTQPTDEQLINLLNGRLLNGDERIGRKKNDEGEVRPGTDLTFSAPKSFSAVKALADQDTAQLMQQAFQESVQDAIAYAESEGWVLIRRGMNGTEKEDARISAACFFHETSRAEDPQTHAHVICFNQSSS